ncbi:alpha/beta-hydrolase [Lindgomyces ingoldianus]|uniref:Alpha/beta-hydrolase n=1 Tax=Lindgomyces ingoldianus TaxID=673940 RepID=A0ACB6QZ98_9PLEO|nr:alpha/beta-hydrolase [Lindgomyces ingoldianus]KAF2472319.1 alpha/beta-hydrolase [Lindgomyces ingoldianus]
MPPYLLACARPAVLRQSLLSRLTCIASKRLFSAIVSSPSRDQVSIPCRSNGSISLDIFRPSTASPSVLVYLPSGPILPDQSEEEERVIAALATTSGSTVVRINYRLSPEYQYPTPIHDVLLGYDWILENLLHDELRKPHLARLGVCGELVGGSLATMLALTECRLGGRSIAAAAVNNPITDWAFPDELPIQEPALLPEPNAPEETSSPADEDLMAWWTKQDEEESRQKPQRQKRKPKPLSLSWEQNSDNSIIPTLLLSGERDVLFRTPEHYLDRFASPIHFFRSPHGKLVYPYDNHGFASMPSEQLQDPLDFETQMSINHYESFDGSPKPVVVPTLVRCRAYARIYPPSGSSLSLPRWHITTGSESPLLDQASELAKRMRRAIARQSLRARTSRVHWADPSEKARYEEDAEQKVHMSVLAGTGLWTQSNSDLEWRSQLAEVGIWMRENLAPTHRTR